MKAAHRMSRTRNASTRPINPEPGSNLPYFFNYRSAPRARWAMITAITEGVG